MMVLGKVMVDDLLRVDKNIRAAIRRWLALPNDTPTTSAPVKNGGLGVPSFRWLSPLHRYLRLSDDTGIRDPFLSKEIAVCEKRLNDQGRNIRSASDIKKRWTDLLHTSIDGRALTDSSLVPRQHQWVNNSSRFFSGRDYVNLHRIRIAALPTLSITEEAGTAIVSAEEGVISLRL